MAGNVRLNGAIGGPCHRRHINTPILNHIDDEVDIAVHAPPGILLGHEDRQAVTCNVAGWSVFDHAILVVVREVYLQVPVICFWFQKDFEFGCKTNLSDIGDQVSEDLGAVATPSEYHSFAIFQVVNFSVVGLDLVIALVHAEDGDKEGVADLVVVSMNDTGIRSLSGTVPGRIEKAVDMPSFGHKDVRVGIKARCIDIQGQVSFWHLNARCKVILCHGQIEIGI